MHVIDYEKTPSPITTITKSNIKVVDRGNIDTPNTNYFDLEHT